MDREKAAALLQTLRLIWFVQLSSCAIFAAIISFEVIPRDLDTAVVDPLLSTQLFPAIGLGMIFLAAGVRRVMTAGLQRSEVAAEEKKQKYILAVILSLVFAESAAVLGFVSWVLGGGKDSALALCAAAAVAVFLCAPKDLEIQ